MRSMAGLPTGRFRVADFAAMAAAAPATVLDVRDPKEADGDTWPGALAIHVSLLERRLAEVPPGEVWVFCRSGYRAAIAASILQRHGRDAVLVADDVSNMRPPAVAAPAT
jgi:rhodanese-related sulfurtransferase